MYDRQLMASVFASHSAEAQRTTGQGCGSRDRRPIHKSHLMYIRFGRWIAVIENGDLRENVVVLYI